MKILAIDIAYRKAIVLCCLSPRGKLLWWNKVGAQSDIYHTSTDILRSILKVGKDTLVVAETPLMIKNINTAYMMVRMYSMLEKGVRDAGMMFFGVHPLTWQAQMLNPKKGDDRKQLSREKASIFMGQDIDDNDLADAINIALFAHSRKKGILKALRGGEKFSEK